MHNSQGDYFLQIRLNYNDVTFHVEKAIFLWDYF